MRSNKDDRNKKKDGQAGADGSGSAARVVVVRNKSLIWGASGTPEAPGPRPGGGGLTTTTNAADPVPSSPHGVPSLASVYLFRPLGCGLISSLVVVSNVGPR